MSSAEYIKVWPGGNTTALVTRVVPRSEQAQLAQDIMARDASIEQVGFIENSDNASAHFLLQMMGGEFCGNAARAAVCWWCREKTVTKVPFLVSGFNDIVWGEQRGEKIRVTLPKHFIQEVTPFESKTVVDMIGIRHVICHDGFPDNHHEIVEDHKGDFAAVGVIGIKTSGEHVEIDPFVWVRETNTFVRETGCGSGSIAAAHVARTAGGFLGQNEVLVKQPSGSVYSVSFDKNEISLESDVAILDTTV